MFQNMTLKYINTYQDFKAAGIFRAFLVYGNAAKIEFRDAYLTSGQINS